MDSSKEPRKTKKEYSGQFNHNLLCEELYEAFPEWATGGNGLGKVLRASNGVKLIFPKETVTSKVDAIIAAHDHTKDSKNQKDAKTKKKLRKNAKQKFKDLGLTADEIEAIIGPDDI